MPTNNTAPEVSTAGRNIYAGLFMVALATLMYEILITRIFSVTMWYHFAFVAISVAMFGMTVGAMFVYLFPNYFTPEKAKDQLALFSLFFAISVVVCFLIHLRIPFYEPTSLRGLASLGLTYVFIAVPFTFSGICVCLALTRFSRQVSALYAADLAGAGLGCVLVIYTLDVTDGPTAVIAVSFLASIGTLFFVAGGGFGKLKWLAFSCSFLLAGVTVTHTILVNQQRPVFRLKWVKGARDVPSLYEKWNSFSRVTVYGDANTLGAPFGWGLSSSYPADRQVRQLFLSIDSAAGTVLTFFRGNGENGEMVEHLKYDVTNLAYYLRPGGDVLVIGSGGGRDVLSALAFGQRSVQAVEINRNIIAAVNQRFGDFTGHLDRYPNVRFVHDEARSYIARQTGTYDIIQISLIDTWAATAAGAFVLTENSLYTVEAWKIFLEHLRPGGILTVSRWYEGESPPEVYRMTALASAALNQLGRESPRKRIMVVRHKVPTSSDAPSGVGTILVSKEPFSDQDIRTLEEVGAKMKFDLVLSPRASEDSVMTTLAEGKDLEAFTSKYPINIAAPTDDNPFFFHMLRFRDLRNLDLWRPGSHLMYNLGAVVVLAGLLILVFALTLVCVIVPLVFKAGRASLKGAAPLIVYFCCIGLGFMLVEISQMQRLIIFLGHPTYGLSVVLFTLLLSGGLGSYLTHRRHSEDTGAGAGRLVLLLCALALFGKLTPVVIGMFQSATTPVRIAAAVGILFILGLFMGMAFPLGMKAAAKQSSQITPWLWGINGATSVCASVLAVVIALYWGISTAFWTGAASYAVALVAFLSARRNQRESVRVG